MKEEQHIQELFQIIRELPPEVELTGIEQFVLAQPAAVYLPPTDGGASTGLLTIKNIIVMISSVSIIGTVALFIGGGNDKPAPAIVPGPDTPKQEVVLLQDSAPVLVDAVQPKTIPAPQDDVAQTLPKPVFPFVATWDTAPINSTRYGIHININDKTEPPQVAVAVEAEQPGECDDDKHVLSTMAKEMFADGLIKPQDFTFTLNQHALVINGRYQSPAVFKKYGNLFEVLTGTKLGKGTHMHALVAPGRCSASLSVDEEKTTKEPQPATSVIDIGQVRTLPPFSVVQVACSANLTIVAGNEYKAEILGDEEESSRFKMDVSGERLTIRTEGSRSRCNSVITLTLPIDKLRRVNVEGSGHVDVQSEFEGVERLEVLGSGNLSVSHALSSPDLHVSVIGSGNIDITGLRATKTSVHIPGSGVVMINGSGNAVTVDIDGSGTADLSNVTAQTAECEISGSGSIFVKADQEIKVEISGSGIVTYSGNAVVTQRITGSGAVIRQ